MFSLAPLRSKSGQMLLVGLILLFGFALRATDIGAAPLQGDEAWLTFLAYDFGHNGQRAELGVTSSAGVNQPPFFHDVFALPFAFDPDPRLARLFMAMLQLVGMAVLYFIVRRFWAQSTTTAALIFYAVLPHAVWAGRFLWNPYLAIPFIIGYMATGLLLAEGKCWAGWLHPPLLACAIGAHPIMAIMAPLSLGFYGRAWFRSSQRRQFLLDWLIGGVLALVVLTPWIVGVIHQKTVSPAQGNFSLRQRTSFEDSLKFVVQVPEWIDLEAIGIPPEGAGLLYDLIGWFTLLSSLFLVARAVVRVIRKQHIDESFPDLMLGLAYLLPLLVLPFSPTRTYSQYFIALVPLAAIIQAVMLTRQPLRFAGLGVGLLICTAELVLVVNVMQRIDHFHDFSRSSMPSLQEMIRIRDEAVRPGVETIYLVDSGSMKAFEQELVWLILANKGASRVIWGDKFALPVPANGATYVGYADAQNIPELYALPQPRFVADGLYRVVDLPPNSGFSPDCRPDGLSRLGNGVRILGYYLPETTSQAAPQPQLPWTFYLLWQGVSPSPHTSFQVFNHLVDANGSKYAQSDLPTLDTDLWHDNELLVSKVTLTPSDNLPVGQPLFLRVGMYSFEDASNSRIVGVNAVDDNGNPIAGWVTIPICTPPDRRP
jgi:hypothetical protein